MVEPTPTAKTPDHGPATDRNSGSVRSPADSDSAEDFDDLLRSLGDDEAPDETPDEASSDSEPRPAMEQIHPGVTGPLLASAIAETGSAEEGERGLDDGTNWSALSGHALRSNAATQGEPSRYPGLKDADIPMPAGAIDRLMTAGVAEGRQGDGPLGDNSPTPALSGAVSTDQDTAPASLLTDVQGLRHSLAPANATRTDPSDPRIGTPAHDPRWSGELSDKIAWMLGRDIQRVDLRLNPEHLGPLEVQIRVDGDRTHIYFSSHSTSIRDLLDSTLPQLRDALTANGMNLGDVNVSQQGAGQQGAPGDGGHTPGLNSASNQDLEAGGGETDLQVPMRVLKGDALVDFFA